MSQKDIVRAWKDAKYRSSLSADELALLPANPAGLIEVADSDLKNENGFMATTAITCTCPRTSRCPTSPMVCGG